MPIYINDKIQEKKPADKFDKFKFAFKEHLDISNVNRIVKPIYIKYIPSLITADPDPANKGKVQKPRSLAIRHISQILEGDSMVDVHYTKTVPKRNGVTGEMTYTGYQGTDVPTMIGTTDIDFAFYFFAYSNQNIANNPNAFLMIENKSQEAADKARVRKEESTINARLWNIEKEGGCTETLLREYARTRPSIASVETLDANELRLCIETDFKLDRTPATKLAFLEFTKQEEIGVKQYMEYDKLISDALEAGIISQNNLGTSFCWKTAEGKAGEVIFNWKEAEGKDKPSIKFASWLKLSEPDLLEKIKAMIAEKALPA